MLSIKNPWTFFLFHFPKQNVFHFSGSWGEACGSIVCVVFDGRDMLILTQDSSQQCQARFNNIFYLKSSKGFNKISLESENGSQDQTNQKYLINDCLLHFEVTEKKCKNGFMVIRTWSWAWAWQDAAIREKTRNWGEKAETSRTMECVGIGGGISIQMDWLWELLSQWNLLLECCFICISCSQGSFVT